MAGKLDIERQFEMFTPKDLVGTVDPNLGGRLDLVDEVNPFRELLRILENNGRGVKTIDDIAAKVLELKTDKGLGGVDLSKFLTIWSSKEIVDIGAQSEKDKIYKDTEGAPKQVANLKEIIGKQVTLRDDTKASIILSTSPFFNPTTRNTKKAEVFLNSMPSVVLASLVPYMQVEFQITRDPSEQLQALSQLKLLMGAANKDELEGANDALLKGHNVEHDGKEFTFTGMEVFTAPVTLTNPQPNKNTGTGGLRYVDVLDPFRPFASLESVTISAKPSGAGYFCYKKANLVLKIHDRSRLHEISDLLRPRVYTGVTIWLTYGWRAPSRGDSNPYFSYVNNNLMMREAYHIINSNFTFDNVGQVSINLELFTKGVAELRELKIVDKLGSDKEELQRIKRLTQQIAEYRKRLRLDPDEGTSKEVRVFQILDAAETGEFPDLKADEVKTKTDALEKAINKMSGIDKDAAAGLIKAMKELNKPDKADPKKFDLKERYERMMTSVVTEMFNEVRTGPDPFLPTSGKDYPEEITKICDDLNKPAATKVSKGMKQTVSFGKLFSVFALQSILSLPETVQNEVQVFFYKMNEQCGPISSCNIASFPIDMNVFIDQFTDLAKQKGGNAINLEDFLQLTINAQFLDKRAIGYGLRTFYKPYEKGKEAELKTGKDNEQAFESTQAAYSFKYGPFKQPTIEMMIECSHEQVAEEGESDILQMLSYSAKDASPTGLPEMKAKSATKIMRIHVYDRQTTSHRGPAALMRSVDDKHFVSVPSTPEALKKAADLENFKDTALAAKKIEAAASPDGAIRLIDPYRSNQAIKDTVAKLVPTIRFGANGTTIISANLSSKADPLLSTVQMIRSQNVKNTAAPNGAGSMGLPLRIIPAQLTMTTLGNPLATMAQQYFIDFQTGTTIDNLYIVTGLNHNFAPGKFDTQWTFGYADGYGVYEGSPNIIDQLANIPDTMPKDPSKK